MADLPLPENDPIERVAVLRTDLEEWQAVLRWAHGLAASLDLVNGYLATRPNAKSSKLTLMAVRSHNRIEGYLHEDNDDVVQER